MPSKQVNKKMNLLFEIAFRNDVPCTRYLMYRRGTVGDVLPNPDARRARRVVGRNSVGSRRHFLWIAEIRTGLHRSSAGQAFAQQNPD